MAVEIRRQRIFRQRVLMAALHGVALLLLGLHLYVRTLPPTPAPIPAPGCRERLVGPVAGDLRARLGSLGWRAGRHRCHRVGVVA
ncbi:MAG: hypothetical protein R2851_00830 [Caldilineaceae bacterium]